MNVVTGRDFWILLEVRGRKLRERERMESKWGQ